MEWVESTGSTIDEAKERALDRLGVHSDDAEFEVVADVKTGLFGRVKEEARVRARVAPAAPRAKDDRRRGRNRGTGRGGSEAGGNNRNRGGRNRNRGGKGGSGQGNGNQKGRDGSTSKDRSGDRQAASDKGRARDGQNGKNDGGRGQKPAAQDDTKNPRTPKKDNTMTDEPTMPLPEQADIAEEFVAGLAERFGTAVTFERDDSDEEEIRITVSGDDLGRMVGRRGTTAGAIDELVRTVLQRRAGSSRNGRIRVDVGGVRARRAEALANFSRAQAAEVRSSGSARSLEPMSAADRKIVHDALTDEDGVDTVSEGEDNQRRVVIVPAGAGD
ncbi:MAG: RNA-binding cell elongation regulator Jag/EloR [Actinomycetota bacterium]